MDRNELDRLSSKELHDLAVRSAVHRLDIKFLWSLVEAVPTAEAAVGHFEEARSDMFSLASRLTDFVHSGDEAEVADALRPMYLDYLERHPPPD
jgi:hypothetical protein